MNSSPIFVIHYNPLTLIHFIIGVTIGHHSSPLVPIGGTATARLQVGRLRLIREVLLNFDPMGSGYISTRDLEAAAWNDFHGLDLHSSFFLGWR